MSFIWQEVELCTTGDKNTIMQATSSESTEVSGGESALFVISFFSSSSFFLFFDLNNNIIHLRDDNGVRNTVGCFCRRFALLLWPHPSVLLLLPCPQLQRLCCRPSLCAVCLCFVVLGTVKFFWQRFCFITSPIEKFTVTIICITSIAIVVIDTPLPVAQEFSIFLKFIYTSIFFADAL